MVKSETRRDAQTLVRDRDLKVLTKSETKTLYEKNQARHFISQTPSRFRKLFEARNEVHDHVLR